MMTVPLAHALAWTLIHFAWQGAAVALMVALVLCVFGRSSARLRYSVACLAMLGMLGAFGSTLVLLWPHAPSVIPDTSARIEGAIFVVPGNTLVNAPAAPSDLLRWLAPAWILGVLLFSVRSLASWLAAQRLCRIGVCAAPDHWRETARRLAKQIRLSRPAALLESCLIDVPVVIGCFRPVILLPAGLLTGFPPEQIECFLMHELAHIRRWDYLVNILQSLAEDLLFYHPAVWWVSSIIRAERENCCDDVVAACGDAPRFAAALAALEQNRASVRQPALAANGGHLMNRIRRLLGQPQSQRTAIVPVLLASALLISITIAMRATDEQSTPPPRLIVTTPAKEQPPVLLAQAQPNRGPAVIQPAQLPAWVAEPYRKWLDEEVPYIITDAERNAFQRLRTEQEIQQFIEQFWLRRDPTPGTEQNEAREEYYSRIAYANDKFGWSVFPGWRSDRGAIYIRFGAPDELESHGAGTYDEAGRTITVVPFERWRYRYIVDIGSDVIMEFVDPNGTGEYHMTRDPSAKEVPPRAPQPPRPVQPAAPAAPAQTPEPARLVPPAAAATPTPPSVVAPRPEPAAPAPPALPLGAYRIGGGVSSPTLLGPEHSEEDRKAKWQGSLAEPTVRPTPAIGAQAQRIAVGDTLILNVWREPDFTYSITVHADGKITVPIAGDLQAEGMTTAEVEIEVRDVLSPYINNPIVSVSVTQVHKI